MQTSAPSSTTASNGIQEIMQAVAEMRLEVDRLGYVNRILVEKIKDLKEEVDMDRVKGVEKDSMVSREHTTKPEADSTSNGSGIGVDRDCPVRVFFCCLQAEGC